MNRTEKIISRKIIKVETVSFRIEKKNGARFVISSVGRETGFITPDYDGTKIANFLDSLPEGAILTISYKGTVTEEENQ